MLLSLLPRRFYSSSSFSSINPFSLEREIKKIQHFRPALQRERISEQVKREVWVKSFEDSTQGFCFACEKDLALDQVTWTKKNKETAAWHCSHIQSIAHGGDNRLHNLTILCRECNLQMNSIHLYEYLIRSNLPGVQLIPFTEHAYWSEQITALLLFNLLAANNLNFHLYTQLKKALHPRYPLEMRMKLLLSLN